ncbi:MAG: cation-translocating P-type ATPase [Eubacteriales bacterium]|nr:cation-translocating P-type ATPase [Clostridia bacterium]MDY2846005.1 cation-translocating P-type ATPase [Eubacteriales bacterium]
MKEYLTDVGEVMKNENSSLAGLTTAEAEKRAEKYGKNKLKAAKKVPLIVRFLSQLGDPMTIILICAAVVSGILAVVEGESFADVIIILAVVLINAVLGVYQESKAENAIEALQEMSAATSKVLRDGETVVIKSEDIVPGDIVFLDAGDSVPADGRLIDCASLKIEESALTGESVPVNKMIDVLNLKKGEDDIPLGDRKNMVYMGSSVAYGRGTLVVTATGMNTEMGKIADALTKAEDSETPLQKKLNQLSKVLTWLVLGICVVIFGVQLIKTGVNADTIVDTFMVAVSLAVAAIPEGLAAVVTVVLSIGVTLMSKRKAIIRHLTAVETLGCAQVICSDKTGTLTQNKMTVVQSYGSDREETARSFALCTDAKLAVGQTVSTGDPTQTAVVDYAAKIGLPKYELEEKYPRVGEIPFDSMRKLMTTVHRDGEGFVQYTTGAPDVVIGKCTSALVDGREVEMTDELRETLFKENKKLADQALRVLASGRKTYIKTPESYEPDKMEQGLCFLGLVGMIDPVRPEVKDAIEECRSAGIRPIMITGDHKDTAVAIARELGIIEEGQYAITGAELSKMDDATFAKEFKNISVYARVQPEHKTRIVNQWRAAGYVTAMTGDGVNDAPSIKSADIGIGMGITGTDVTKNVADMVLADDNFATIVSAVEEGRRIYDNIRKAIQFLLGSNMSEVITIFVATLIGFNILEPVHLLWINLITDTFPALALGMEKAEADIMKRKPRDANEGVFSGGLGFDVAYQGILISALVIISYGFGHMFETGAFGFGGSAHGTTMAFLTLSMAEIFHSFNLRSREKSLFKIKGMNKMLNIAAIVSLALTTAVCEIPVLASAFDFTAVGLREYATAALLGFCVIPVVEVVKLIRRQKNK